MTTWFFTVQRNWKDKLTGVSAFDKDSKGQYEVNITYQKRQIIADMSKAYLHFNEI